MATTRPARPRNPRPGPPAGPSFSRPTSGAHLSLRQAWLPGLLILAGTLAYVGSFDGVFLLDDGTHIARNQHIRHLLQVWDVLRHGRRPVLNLSLAFNYALGGLNVWGYHAFNLAVHILAGLTLFGVIRRTTDCGLRIGDCGSTGGSVWRSKAVVSRDDHAQPNASLDRATHPQSAFALVVSLIWVVHPLQTQSVTYIIQRSESMMGLFYLLTLYCLIRGSELRRGRLWYTAAVAACALGMGSKAVMVTAPVMLLLYDGVFLSDSIRQALRRRWALYLGLAGTWVVLVATRVVRGVLFPSPQSMTDVGFGFTKIAPADYALTQLGVVVHYLRLSFWPHPLCLDYGWPVATGAGAIVAPATIILSLLIASVWAFRRKPWLGFAGAWFFVILAPTSSIIPIKDVIFEHRMYLSLAAVVIVCVAAGNASLGYLCRRFSAPDPIRRWLTTALVVLVVLTLARATTKRNRDYQSEVAMWANVIAHRPNHARAHYNLGHALMMQDQHDEAIDAYRRTIQIYPNHVSARYNMGHALVSLGRLQEAVEQYRQVVRIDSATTYQSWTSDALSLTFAQAHNSRGNALLKLGRTDEAIDAYRQAVRTRPGLVRAHYNMGNALAKAGKLEEAMEAFRQALRLNPRYANAHLNLGNVLFTLGRLAEATDAYRQAVRINPRFAMARYNLGSALQAQSLFDAAVEEFRAALNIEPDNPAMREALDAALAALHNRESK